jgi:hypothetical protein
VPPVTRAEIERFLREEMALTEIKPGVWLRRAIIPDIGVMQPFSIIVRLFDHAIEVAIDLGLLVDSNHEAVYEYLLEASGRIILGKFFIGDDERILIGVELPCGASNASYFSPEELALMTKVLFDAIKDNYNRIVQLIHRDRRRGPGGPLGWLRAARERQQAG